MFGLSRCAPAASVLAISLSLLGCGASDSFHTGVYRHGAIAFQLDPVPREWRRVSLQGANLVFRDEAHEGSILVDARCNLSTETPLAALTQQLVIGTTERELIAQDTIPFDQREALHTRMRAKLDGVQMEYAIYVLKKDGCVYDFVYVAPPTTFSDGMPAFDQLVASFHTLARSGTP